MFRPLFGHHQLNCLCLDAGLVFFFNVDPYFEYDYITYNITLGNQSLGIVVIFSIIVLVLGIIILITVYLV